MEHNFDQGVGAEIKRLREEREWSMAKLAVEADMSVSGVSMIENGKRNLTTTTLAKLARAFGVEVRDLFPLGQAPLPEIEDERHPKTHTAAAHIQGTGRLEARGKVIKDMLEELFRQEITPEEAMPKLERILEETKG
jgi:transcriptional regulator with XRE-family HTH domain